MSSQQPVPDFGLDDPRPRRGRLVLLGALGLLLVAFAAGGVFATRVAAENGRAIAGMLAPRPIASLPEAPAPAALENPVTSIVAAAQSVIRSAPVLAPSALQPVLPQLPGLERRERLNVLLLGIDRRPEQPIEQSRSDTLMIVSIDPVSRSVAMISIPRDLWVPIPAYGEQRINVAHALGGPSLAARTIQANFNVPIHRYARIDFHGFERLVDAMGGVPVDVERPVKDDEYPTEDYGIMRIYIPAGPQWMDGRTALQYARSRHGENDFGRARRQQRVLMAMRDRALQTGMLWKAPELIGLLPQVVNHDFQLPELLGLAKLATEIKSESIANLVIDHNYATGFMTYDGASVLAPNRPAIQAAIQQTLSRAVAQAPTPTPLPPTPTPNAPPPTPTTPPPPARVAVLNGSARVGLGQATASLLQARGVNVVSVGNAARDDTVDTRLLARPGREPQALALARSLGLPDSAVQTSAEGGVSAADITIVLGSRFQVPPPR